jgi:ATP-binding cassette subfamily B protein
MPAEKAKDFKGSAKKLIAYMGAYKWIVLLVFIIAAGSVVLVIFGPKLLARATDELVNGFIASMTGTGSVNFMKIGQILLQTGALYLTSALIRWLQGHIMANVTTNLTYRLRRDISLKFNKLPLNYYDKTAHGDILSRITNDVDTIGMNLSQSITQAILSTAIIIGYIIIMLTINVTMTLVVLCMIPVTIFFVALIIRKSQKYFKSQQEYIGHVNGHVEEMYGAFVVVKAFNGEKASIEQFEKYNQTLYDSAWKANFFSGLMMPIVGFVGNLGYVAVCLVGGYSAINGTMTIGDIQAFIMYVRNFNQNLSQMAQLSSVLQSTAAAAERVFAFLDEEEELPETAEPKTIKNNAETGNNLSFENVTFGYNPDTLVINNFTSRVKAGQKIAIVGPTGAGKTTIVKLLMRFYDINSGAVLINGTDIRDVRRDDLRSLFGMVLQDAWLFNGTIADNIKYGTPDATDEEVRAAAVAAQIDHFIHTLPDGYDMVLNEETDNISQGQKQLLTIARAILADSEILILDEATSSVDTRTEILIQKAMDYLMRGRTSFIIAHRLSTIKNADLILVMRDGDIVEQGTHTELLAQNNFYAELYNSQFEPIAL